MNDCLCAPAAIDRANPVKLFIVNWYLRRADGFFEADPLTPTVFLAESFLG